MNLGEFLNQLHKATRKSYRHIESNNEIRLRPRNRNVNTPISFCPITAVARYNGLKGFDGEDGETAAEKLGLSPRHAELIMNVSDGEIEPNGVHTVLKGKILKAIKR